MQCGFAKLSIHTKMGKHLMYLCIRVRLVMEFLIWWVKILKEKNLWIDIFWTETDNFAIFLFQSGSPKSKTLLIKLSTYLLVLFKCWPTKGKKSITKLTLPCIALSCIYQHHHLALQLALEVASLLHISITLARPYLQPKAKKVKQMCMNRNDITNNTDCGHPEKK